MKVTLWGTRGSLAAPGPETARYGGNTSCVQVQADDGSVLVLDAGTGIRRLGDAIADRRSHRTRRPAADPPAHGSHPGLGFFEPLFRPAVEVHIWGPSSTTQDLRVRLGRYLSPPLFPVRLRDLPRQPLLHDAVREGRFEIGPFTVHAELVCHPGSTVGYRIEADGASLAYLPDHEPALGLDAFPEDPDDIPGLGLAESVDLLIHDAMYTAEEYPRHVGWGHSSLDDAMRFAAAARVERLIPFHHDPSHGDDFLDRLFEEATASPQRFELLPGGEGSSYTLGSRS